MPRLVLISPLLGLLALPPWFVRSATGSDAPTTEEAERALARAVEFFSEEVSSHGGYVWRYSADLTARQGEAVVGPTTIWVQPPGTPSVGEAMLDVYLSTGLPAALEAAQAAADALCRGQMRSGGWHYSIEFDPELRPHFDYREDPDSRPRSGRQYRMTTLDDDTTQAAIRFLVRLDEVLGFEDERIHDAAQYALNAVVRAQQPNGGWYVWWVSYPDPTSEDDAPVRPASYPETWERTWPNSWQGRYVTNDNLVSDLVETLLLASRVYHDPVFLAAAERAGDFLILAQMPDPQPAWAQQYNEAMQPEWARKFEPPAISGGESQTILRTLLQLYRVTGKEKFLEPVPKALDYLRRSRLPDGRLARFYELKTNRPLYFTKDYQLTYSSDDMPTHYGFIVTSRLDRIEEEYHRLLDQGVPHRREPSRDAPRMTEPLARRARELIEAMDERGAWLGGADSGSPIIESATFSQNVRTLAQFVAASRGQPEDR